MTFKTIHTAYGLTAMNNHPSTKSPTQGRSSHRCGPAAVGRHPVATGCRCVGSRQGGLGRARTRHARPHRRAGDHLGWRRHARLAAVRSAVFRVSTDRCLQMSEPSEHEYKGPERRRSTHLTDELIEEISESAAARAVEKLNDHPIAATSLA